MNGNWHGQDPEVMLCLAVIARAQLNVRNSRAKRRDRQSAARFFLSEWYRVMLRFVLEEVGCVLWGDGYPQHVDGQILDYLLSEMDKS